MINAPQLYEFGSTINRVSLIRLSLGVLFSRPAVNLWTLAIQALGLRPRLILTIKATAHSPINEFWYWFFSPLPQGSGNGAPMDGFTAR